MANPRKNHSPLQVDPLWYKDAIIYETHVRAFCDSNGDGIGDFPGLTQKLDYLHDLGVTAVWVLPFCPSPLKDDGYDIQDYTSVNPSYGTLRDVEIFLREAHQRGIRVISEIVPNHTSDQHAWFQRARRAKPGSRARDFYVWSEHPHKYSEVRIIFQDFETSNWTWDPVAKAYYWHRFYSHQPDLNYDNPAVRKAITQALDFWFNLGVDGLRLDAIPYLYERDGTNCENLAETHAFIKELRRHVDHTFQDKMFLAEANQWPEDAAAYFGQGDECHMNFHFPLMPRLFMALHTEDRFPIIDILDQTPLIPDNCQWGIFLRNHDELTLEMVTDEERDYMYRAYAHDRQMRINLGIRRRLAPLLGNRRRPIELLSGLLFSLPGTPIMYYGDEIGMGDNIYLGDRNAVRTPMQWSADRNAGFSRANPQQLYLPVIIDPEYHYETINVEAQQANPGSLLWWNKRLIALRKRYPAFRHGSIEFLRPENSKVLTFLRRYEDECLLIVANLSRFAQYVELDLSAFQGLVPIEMFGQASFPPIGELPYLLTLGPHAFYWFSLESQQSAEGAYTLTTDSLPRIRVAGKWEAVFLDDAKKQLETRLVGYLADRRWFAGKAYKIQAVSLADTIPIPYGTAGAFLTTVRVAYVEHDAETYLLPLTIALGAQAEQIQSDAPQAVIARIQRAEETGVVYDAMWDPVFCQILLDAFARRRRWKGRAGELWSVPLRAFRSLRKGTADGLPASVIKAEQSNTSITYGETFMLKLYRRMAEGQNPDAEIGQFLTERAGFPHTPPLAGLLEYRPLRGESSTVAVLQGFVPNEGDAWQYTLDAVRRYYEVALAHGSQFALPEQSIQHPLDGLEHELPELAYELIGFYLESVRLLGQRTAELHRALASAVDDPAFTPEPFSTLYQRSLYQSLRNQLLQNFQLLRQQLKRMPPLVRDEANKALAFEQAILDRFRAVSQIKITALRTRHHGDYHLGQILYTGNDFAIIDFEGEPARPLSERRIKRSPLRDVAGMLRSFHYAAYAGVFERLDQIGERDRGQALKDLEPWGEFWYSWVATTFLQAYLAGTEQAVFLPQTRTELRTLLDVYVLGKAVYELAYELNNRPDWVRIPLQGISQLLAAER